VDHVPDAPWCATSRRATTALRLHVEFVEALAAERVGEILRAAGIHD
jgi:hypothetical protein